MDEFQVTHAGQSWALVRWLEDRKRGGRMEELTIQWEDAKEPRVKSNFPRRRPTADHHLLRTSFLKPAKQERNDATKHPVPLIWAPRARWYHYFWLLKHVTMKMSVKDLGSLTITNHHSYTKPYKWCVKSAPLIITNSYVCMILINNSWIMSFRFWNKPNFGENEWGDSGHLKAWVRSGINFWDLQGDK